MKDDIDRTSHPALAKNMKEFEELNGLPVNKGLLRKWISQYTRWSKLLEYLWLQRAVIHKSCSNKVFCQNLNHLKNESS